MATAQQVTLGAIESPSVLLALKVGQRKSVPKFISARVMHASNQEELLFCLLFCVLAKGVPRC